MKTITPSKSPMKSVHPKNSNKSDFIKVYCRIRPIEDHLKKISMSINDK